jgi:hypothetical protein
LTGEASTAITTSASPLIIDDDHHIYLFMTHIMYSVNEYFWRDGEID